MPSTPPAARLDAIRDIGDHAAYEEACRAEDAAFDELTETPPVTLPGMRALAGFSRRMVRRQ